jgi:nitrous oxidase accessory protein NosD
MNSEVKPKMSTARMRTRTLFGAVLILLGLFAFAAPAPSLIEPVPSSFAAEVDVLKVPGDYATIQAAVDAANPGDIIQVRAGVYNENVVIVTSGLRLHGSSGAVIDGDRLTGSGILVLGTAAQPVTGVVVSGFEVRDFQRGIVVQWATQARIRGNEVHDNTKWTAIGLESATGIDVVTTHFSDVSENIVHHNGYRGIGLRLGSTNDVLRANRIYENGTLVTTAMDGLGILVTGPTNDNKILANEILRNYGRGIMLSRPVGTTPITGNLVAENRLHENQRAGICIMTAAQDNYILQNDAKGNNLSGLPPCLTFNLFEMVPGSNVWERNQGTSNF